MNNHQQWILEQQKWILEHQKRILEQQKWILEQHLEAHRSRSGPQSKKMRLESRQRDHFGGHFGSHF